jgi:hypothetical protein
MPHNQARNEISVPSLTVIFFVYACLVHVSEYAALWTLTTVAYICVTGGIGSQLLAVWAIGGSWAHVIWPWMRILAIQA